MKKYFAVLFLTALLTGIIGCGGDNNSVEIAQNPIEAIPAEMKTFPVYFQEDEGTFRNTLTGNIISVEEAQISLSKIQPPDDSIQALGHVSWTKIRIPIWNSRHSWHWLYSAYDSGHPFPSPKLNNRGHINICRYQTWSQLRADEKERTSKRAFYDGHFTIYKDGGGYCAYYYVSKDIDTGFKGPKFDSCISKKKARSTAELSVLVLGLSRLWVGLKGSIGPVMQDLQVIAGIL